MDTICRRDIKLSDYNISRAKYNELKYFCIQYAEKKQKLQNAYGLKATVNDGMPKSNLSGDSTAQEAVRNAMMQEDIKLIEETARKASPEIYKWVLKNVTEGTPYEWMDVPVGRRQFYEYRRYFFYIFVNHPKSSSVEILTFCFSKQTTSTRMFRVLSNGKTLLFSC